MAGKRKRASTGPTAPAAQPPRPKIAAVTTGAQHWTPDQRRAISEAGKRILVSAAAGSGKTSVLAERCAFLVCDAPEPYRCDVDELLVVTFTVAAANEMRARIAAALRSRHDAAPSARLARQMALIDRATIGTVDGFCSAVVRQHFHVLGIDPNFQMISEEEGALLRGEVVRDLFADRYEQDDTGAFQRLVDLYGDGNDSQLRQRVVRTHELLGSLVWPDAWKSCAVARLTEAADVSKPLRETQLGAQLYRRVERQLSGLRDGLVALAGALHARAELHAYEEYTNEMLAAVESWRDALSRGGIDALSAEAKELTLGRLPTIKALDGRGAILRDRIVDLRDCMKKPEKSRLLALCRFTEAEWHDGMARTLEPAGVFLDLVNAFGERYSAAKHELRVLDFADLERNALRALLGDTAEPGQDPLPPSAAALEYQRRYKHVLVDEYQDINELQDTILALVSRGAADQSNAAEDNLFCVGDVKQSIYRFRLADPGRFIARYTSMKRKGARASDLAIDLQTNFRSRGPLLDTLNCVFERLMSEEAAEIAYDDAQRLRAPEDSPYLAYPMTGSHVELHILPENATGDADDTPGTGVPDAGTAAPGNRGGPSADDLDRAEREAVFVAQRIHELMGRGGVRTGAANGARMSVLAKPPSGGAAEWRPIRFGDMAILLRAMRFRSETLADILRGSGIPVHADAGTGFFASTEVQDVIALLKVLDNPRQDIPLAALLRSPIAGIPAAEDALATIRLAHKSTRDRPVPFHEAVFTYAREGRDALGACLRTFVRTIGEWRELASRRPLAEVLWYIYDRSGYLAFCEGLDDGAQRVANLVGLHERARQFGSFRKQGLGRFMRFLDSLRDEVEDLGKPSAASEADDAVRIMSVHRSKGLEFPVVFLPDLGKRHNISDSTGNILVERDAGIGLSVCDEDLQIRYPSLASTLVADRLRRQSLAEELRVLYVATTRARERLILVGTCKHEKLDQWRQSHTPQGQAFPADDVLGSSTMLDWVGPALASVERDPEMKTRASFELVAEPAPSAGALPRARRPELTDWQKSRGRLEPLAPVPAPSERAEATWSRITAAYPHQPYTRLNASGSVTSTVKTPVVSRTASPPLASAEVFDAMFERRQADDGFAPAGPFVASLRVPAFPFANVEGNRAGGADTPPTTSAPASAADIGTATHAFLEHVDFARRCDLADLRAQRVEAVERRLLAPALAEAIDLESVHWFCTATSLGAMLREHAPHLRRELAINYPEPAETYGLPRSADPLDCVMIRGRIDVLVPLAEGAIIVDFKTDHPRDESVLLERIGLYTPQLRAYARAVHALLGRSVAAAHLVFLSVRRVESISLR